MGAMELENGYEWTGLFTVVLQYVCILINAFPLDVSGKLAAAGVIEEMGLGKQQRLLPIKNTFCED